MKNVVEKANSVRGKKNFRYDLGVGEIHEILTTYQNDMVNLISCAFNYGYLQGGKAAKAEKRKENVA